MVLMKYGIACKQYKLSHNDDIINLKKLVKKKMTKGLHE
jgi:hypothetical protein